MRKDPTEFRKRFVAWKNGKKPYQNGRPEPIQRIDNSEADFAQRLRSPWRQEIWDLEGSGKAATHKMSSADNIVYPNVQTTKGGGLIDFTHPMWEGVVDPLNRAIINKDYVPMKTEQDAIWFGPNYKEYYPKFKDGKLPGYGDGTPTRVGDYNVYPSAIGASELSVTTPEIVIKPRQKYPDTSDYYMWNPSNFTFQKYLDRKVQQLRSLEGGDNEKVAQRIYNTITPRIEYFQPYNLQGLINARKQYENNVQRKFLREGVASDLLGGLYMNRNRTREAQFAKYLGLPTFKYNRYDDGVYEDSVNTYLRPARYTPTKGNPLGDLVMLPRHESYEDELSDLNLAALYRSAQKGDSIVNFQNSATLGNYSGGIGKDSLGNYISYYDEWDINPLKGENSKDLFQQYDIGHPFSLYDRRYFSQSELKRALKKYDKAHTDRLLYDQTH